MQRPALACIGTASVAIATSNTFAALSPEGGDSSEQQQQNLPAENPDTAELIATEQHVESVNSVSQKQVAHERRERENALLVAAVKQAKSERAAQRSAEQAQPATRKRVRWADQQEQVPAESESSTGVSLTVNASAIADIQKLTHSFTLDACKPSGG